jgi:hypothetical protein
MHVEEPIKTKKTSLEHILGYSSVQFVTSSDLVRTTTNKAQINTMPQIICVLLFQTFAWEHVNESPSQIDRISQFLNPHARHKNPFEMFLSNEANNNFGDRNINELKDKPPLSTCDTDILPNNEDLEAQKKYAQYSPWSINEDHYGNMGNLARQQLWNYRNGTGIMVRLQCRP